jgi:hypothetical protein
VQDLGLRILQKEQERDLGLDLGLRILQKEQEPDLVQDLGLRILQKEPAQEQVNHTLQKDLQIAKLLPKEPDPKWQFGFLHNLQRHLVNRLNFRHHSVRFQKLELLEQTSINFNRSFHLQLIPTHFL